MAKGQMRRPKEKKKPKADQGKKKGGLAPHLLRAGAGPGQPGSTILGSKKGS